MYVDERLIEFGPESLFLDLKKPPSGSASLLLLEGWSSAAFLALPPCS